MQAERALSHVCVYNRRIFMPTHHDGSYNGLWRSTEPIFQSIEGEFPHIITLSNLTGSRCASTLRRAASRARRPGDTGASADRTPKGDDRHG